MEKCLHIDAPKKTVSIDILPQEYWYGGAVNDGYLFPLSAEDEYELNVDRNDTYCQINPVYVSSEGRYLWFEGGRVKFGGGKIRLETSGYELCTAGSCLRDAALAAAAKHYPPDGTLPDEAAFTSPQFCTWMALGVNQSEEGILAYAEKILSMGIRPGVLILDDGWQKDYGDWNFTEERFRDPVGMMKRLKAMGFKVMLWLVPYISPAAPAYGELKARGALVKDGRGEVYKARWWKDESAVLDLTTDYAREWLAAEFKRMQAVFVANVGRAQRRKRQEHPRELVHFLPPAHFSQISIAQPRQNGKSQPCPAYACFQNTAQCGILSRFVFRTDRA